MLCMYWAVTLNFGTFEAAKTILLIAINSKNKPIINFKNLILSSYSRIIILFMPTMSELFK